MAKVSIKSSGFKSFKSVKVSKSAPTVSKPKTITSQKPNTVGKPVAGVSPLYLIDKVLSA